MNETIFLDANVLVYARDSSEPEKQPLAQRWLTHLWQARRGRLSYQVLDEFYVAVTRKLKPGMEPNAARRDVRNLTVWDPLPIDKATVMEAWALEDQFSLSWWDALIVAAANIKGCRWLLSEDFEDQAVFGAVQVINPFIHTVDEFQFR